MQTTTPAGEFDVIRYAYVQVRQGGQHQSLHSVLRHADRRRPLPLPAPVPNSFVPLHCCIVSARLLPHRNRNHCNEIFSTLSLLVGKVLPAGASMAAAAELGVRHHDEQVPGDKSALHVSVHRARTCRPCMAGWLFPFSGGANDALCVPDRRTKTPIYWPRSSRPPSQLRRRCRFCS
jgi:hypothetical protein